MKTAAMLLSALLLAAAATPARAALVRLKDGGSIEGSVVGASAGELVIQTGVGTRRVDADLVRSVEYEPRIPPGAALPPSTRGHSISVGLGLAAPLSDVDFGSVGGGSASNGDLGPMIGARYLRTLTPRFSAGLDLDYLHRGGTDSPGLLPRADAAVSGDSLLFLALVRWHLIERGFARPYVLGGAGASRSWTRIEAAPIHGFTWTDTNTDESRRLVDDSVWAFAAAARLGVDFDWGFYEPSDFSLEAGWTRLESRRYGAAKHGRDLGIESVSGRLDLFTLVARWGWRW